MGTLEEKITGRPSGGGFLHHRLACISLVVLAVICTAAILAPVIAPYDPDAIAGPFGAPPNQGSCWEQTRSDGICSPAYYMQRVFLCWWACWLQAISTAIEVSLGLLGDTLEAGWT